MTTLPEWLLKELPEIKEPSTLSYENGEYIALSPNGLKKTFNTIDEAYDYAQKEWNSEVELDKSLPEYHENSLHVWGKRSNHGVRILISSSDKKKLKELEEDYEEFLKLAEEYYSNPEDFNIVYRFVDCHPAFWNRHSKEHPWLWSTEGHCALHNGKLTLEPVFEQGKHSWFIETGSHVETDYNTRYHDYRLDSKGETVEEAFVNLAKLIDKFYNLDGSDKGDVPHIKPQWILNLEKSLEKRKLD